MPNTYIKRNNTLTNSIPTAPSSLEYGELAMNYKSGYERLFAKNDAGVIFAFNDWTKIFNKPTTLAGYGINDNVNNLNGNLYTDRLTEPNYKIGGITNTARPIFDILRGDRTAFLPAEQIIIEFSTDAGVTWTDAGISDTTKRKLFTGQRPSLNIPLKNGVKSTDCMMRITVTGMKYNVPSGTTETDKYNYWNSTYVQSTERYFSAQEAWMWVTSNTDRIYLKIEKATGANSNSWILDREAYLTGWSGGNYISMGGGVFGGGTTQTGNYWNYRFTFRTCTNSNTFNDAQLSTSYTTSSQTISHIKVSGQNVWTSSNYYMYNEHMYTWDEYKNVTFPSNVTASSFIGNASSATKLANTKTIWGQNFDGSGNVSGSMYGVRSLNNDVIDYMTTGGQYFYTMSNNQYPLLSLLNNVGINTTDPQYKLDVRGSFYAFSATVAGSITFHNDQTERFIRSNSYGGAIRLRGDSSSASDRGIQLGRVDNNLSFTSFLNVNANSGNVSIGSTADNGYKLDVAGTFRVNYNYSTTFTGNDINFTRTDGSSYINAGQTLSLGAGGTSGVLNLTNANVATFKELLLADGARIYSSAGAGLGISLFNEPSFNPNYGLMFAQTVYKGKHGAVNGDWATYFTMSPDAGRGWIFTNSASSSAGNVASISNTGNLTCSGEVTAYSSSDIRLKTNIKPITSAIDVINKLNPVSYNWNTLAKELNPLKGDNVEYGLIAQELEEVLPELVHPIYDGEYKSVDYVKIVPLLIGAIKELQLEINELKNK